MNDLDRGTASARPPTPRWLLALLATLLTALLLTGLGWIGLELAARSKRFVDDDIAERIAAAENPRRELGDLAAYTELVYGWDWPPLPLPPEVPADAPRPDILFLGDSVTRGFGLAAPERESFPVLLQARLSVQAPIHAVNAAVPGFGIDQMALKLGAELDRRRPRLVVIAYIPHDLYRSGRNINFGITKPVLSRYANGAWQMRPAPDLFDFYQAYLDARSEFRLGAWWLRFLADNQQYFLPRLNRTTYRTRFEGIRAHLHDLAAEHGVRIMLVRLANGKPGGTVTALDRWATRAFSLEAGGSPRFIDIEPCAAREAAARHLDLDREFDGHPGARAHAIFARCLLPIVAAELAARP